jgi:phosphatidate cytidylyltransferase
MSKKNEIIKTFGVMFLFFSFYSAFYIRENYGLNTFLFILIVCIFTDIGGYIFGKTFKGPKLTKISPNKTYAGVIGSFLFSLIAGLVFIRYFWNSESYRIESDQLLLLAYILFISLISQIGDLIISYFKRKAKLKDTGKILPGHGGLLDRIDGLIFVIPIIYLLTV